MNDQGNAAKEALRSASGLLQNAIVWSFGREVPVLGGYRSIVKSRLSGILFLGVAIGVHKLQIATIAGMLRVFCME
jgi:hypothetical protein